jgi:hypothetical protein
MTCDKCQYQETIKWENLNHNDPLVKAGKLPYVERFTIETICTKNNGIDCPYHEEV